MTSPPETKPGSIEHDVTETTTAETGVETNEEYRVLPDEDDEGKPVVDTSGKKIGEVIDVNDGVAYVDSSSESRGRRSVYVVSTSTTT